MVFLVDNIKADLDMWHNVMEKAFEYERLTFEQPIDEKSH